MNSIALKNALFSAVRHFTRSWLPWVAVFLFCFSQILLSPTWWTSLNKHTAIYTLSKFMLTIGYFICVYIGAVLCLKTVIMTYGSHKHNSIFHSPQLFLKTGGLCLLTCFLPGVGWAVALGLIIGLLSTTGGPLLMPAFILIVLPLMAWVHIQFEFALYYLFYNNSTAFDALANAQLLVQRARVVLVAFSFVFALIRSIVTSYSKEVTPYTYTILMLFLAFMDVIYVLASGYLFFELLYHKKNMLEHTEEQ